MKKLFLALLILVGVTIASIIVVNLIFFLTTIIKPVYVLLIILSASLIGLLALTL